MMSNRFNKKTIVMFSLFLLPALAAQAAPIRSLANLSGISIFESSGGTAHLFYLIGNPIGDAALNVRLDDRLSGNNSDYWSPANEFYDFYFSDADGSFNVDGAFLTISAVYDNDLDSGLNINGARLEFSDGTLEYADSVASFVGLGSAPFPATVGNALGDTPGTTTFLGDTLGLADDMRLSLTLGFASSAPTPVPEPAAGWLLGTALIGLLLARRHRLSSLPRI